MDYQELLQIKERVEKGKQKLSELKGAKTNQMEMLKKEFNCNTLEEANTLKKKYEKELEVIDKKIEVSVEQLQDTYPDLFND